MRVTKTGEVLNSRQSIWQECEEYIKWVKTKSSETTYETFMVHGRDANGLNSGRNSGDGRNGWTWEMLKKRKGLIQLTD